MLKRARQIEIETAVVELLEDYDIKTYPISISKTAKALRINLIPYSALPERERNAALSASNDAFTYRNADFSIIGIAVNDEIGSNFCRARFSGGHEIGHAFLGHEPNTPHCEEEADYFSGYLLAPHPLILVKPSNASIEDRFGVSKKCADFAADQAVRRDNENAPWRHHERWLLENATWKGGGLFGRA
ncbi:ImmA/IrrE family metallo-endopeptidase [Denitrobacterium detoxificans]|uniref:ImmA/IrrE family metallo-endopeptidase n=1 Tax=Denitrobacterium detoxificans TaxID=79604 RepID=UPI0026EBD413|nr:ImmA/IrrE family metallo-endopeptidase [Denitrobacterium detoxificans]MBE6465802.1 ImmA/IrrE family metallo-endopeptidase [Denitrobacterium detoxificans]